MNERVERLRQMEREISDEKGEFYLFGVFLREEAPDTWDLVVAAPWAMTDQKEVYRYLASKVQEHFSTQELAQLSRIVIVNPDNPGLDAITRAVVTQHGAAEVKNCSFFGLEIKHAYIITSRRPDVPVEARTG